MSLHAIVAVLSLIGGAGSSTSEFESVVVVWQVPAVQDTAYGCLLCHADKRRSFTQGVHSDRDIRCHDCHGGNPRSAETEPAHRGMRFDVSNKSAVARHCSSCHSDPDQMRQYGLPAGEMAEFRTSRHGQVLFQGNTDAPTCTDCHDAHIVLRRTDARSSVHPTNIPATCAKCHENAAMMQKYGLPTDQFARYSESAHYSALFENGNLAAPTCIGCHGSHSALPPKATEISTVCDRCHVLLGTEFHDSPHGRAARAGAIPGCLACHENHGTRVPAPEEMSALCTSCHTADSPAAAVGVSIQVEVTRARDELQLVQRDIEAMARQGRRVADARFRYRTAFTAYSEIAKAQHRLDVDMVADLRRQVSSIASDIRETAEASEERRWEHRLLLFPVWFLTLAAVVLALFKLGTLRKPEQ
jgi:predicted CXXCH cytochrome family protein